MATRVDDLIIERCGSELVVFAPAAQEAHALNETASLIFDMCDGVNTRAQMVAALRDAALPADAAIVDLALADLAESSLVVLDDQRRELGVSRRAVIRRLGLSATAIAMLPVVDTILVQPAAAQTSGPMTTTTFTTTGFTTTGFTTTAFTPP